MPVTFSPASLSADSVETAKSQTSATLFNKSCPQTWNKCEEVLQSSFGQGPNVALDNTTLPATGGLVTTIVNAYCRHHALSIRPDDVWLTILTQFNFYVNAHAEELRDKFVAHKDKEELTVVAIGTRYTVDFGSMANQMVKLMDKFIVDPDLRAWILPKFTTTTLTDTTTAAVLMMATMKEYFSYTFQLRCGIPRVTLEGEKADWEEILRRASKLKQYGAEPSAWFDMLSPILTRFVRAFDEPDATENLEFWQKVAHYQIGGSGPSWLSGWLTVFCVWDTKGKWLGLPHETAMARPGSMKDIIHELSKNPFSRPKTVLSLDGACYHVLDASDIPPGHAEVDIKLDDNGEIFDAAMVAGVVASHAFDSGDTALSKDGTRDVVRPVPGWWMFIKRKSEKKQEERKKRAVN